jgi:chemotaxis signal transduction protein
MVCFRTAQGRFALPVESTLAVRTSAGLVCLPSARTDIIGLLPGDPPLTVLTTLGAGGDHILVVSANHVRFGLQVLEVLGVRRIADDDVGPPPAGQQADLIVGTLNGDELVLVADAEALATRL